MADFSKLAESDSKIILWTDFERANETHFWSATKKTFIEPEVSKSVGTRIVLETGDMHIWIYNVTIMDFFYFENTDRFGSNVLAYGDGKIKNADVDIHAFCVCKHLGKMSIKTFDSKSKK